jgi:hypothetical protein
VSAAYLEEEYSLARHRPFRIAMRELKSVPLIRGWVDPRGLAYLSLGLNPQWGGASYGEALTRIEQSERRALEEARSRGATPEVLAGIDEYHARAQEDLERGPRPDALRRVMGDVEGAGMALDVTPDGLRLRLFVDTADDALVKRIWRNGAGVPRIVRALNGAPLALLAVGLDLEAVEELVRLLPHDGENLTRLAREMSGGLDVADLLTGELEIAVTPRGEAASGLDDILVGAALGVRDEEAAHRVLDAVARLDEDSLRRVEAGWRLSVPDLPAMTLVISDGRLVAATDEALLEALVEGEGGSFEPERALRLVERRGSALAVAVAAGLPILEEMGGSAMWTVGSTASSRHDPEIPRSKAYREKLEELETLDERLSDQMMAVERERRQWMLSLVEPLGHVAATLRVSGHGLELELRYQTQRGTLVDVIADGVEASELRRPPGPERRRLEALWAQRDALEAELDDLFRQDRARWETEGRPKRPEGAPENPRDPAGGDPGAP